MITGEVWYVRFPYEEDPTKTSERPSLIINVVDDDVTIVKITKHKPRDPFDVRLLFWKDAGLSIPSTVRISKMVNVKKRQLINKKGSLHHGDSARVAQALGHYLS
ncbi:type II toxin-antitoxin system PemK/MazF family toxin [Bacillus cereus]|nr:type II toxin-antitoxin system PemK/MazF family toxin [Bacillus cereus]MDA2306080.1 type II toxin-antitoxin system PemK/MazF family toxin [Bacillus cereus]